MATITTNGLGSGLDINSIVKSLVDSQSAPKTVQLDRLKAQTDAKISGVGQLKSVLEAFQTAMKDLTKANAFIGLSAMSSKAEQIGVTATSDAAAGTYQVKVSQLASSSKVATGTVAAGTTFSAGKLAVSIGSDSYDVDVAEGASLQQVRDAINSQLKSKGVTANVVSDPANPAAGSRLVLGSLTTGSGKDISISSANTSLNQLMANGSIPSVDGSAGYITKAQNALFAVDGLELSSSTNKVEGAVSGITFELKADAVGKTTSLTVGPNKEGLTASVQKFVDAYNQLIKVSDSLTKVSQSSDGKTATTGALVGDSSLRQLLNTVRKELSTPAESGEIKILADLGITSQNDGTLAINTTKLNKVLDSNPEALGTFFSGDKGLFNRLDNQVKVYTQTGGILASRSESLNGTLTSITKQREAHERSMTALETRLYAQYNAMDSLVSQLNSTGSSLLSSLENLASSKD